MAALINETGERMLGRWCLTCAHLWPQNAQLKEEVQRLTQRIRVMEDEVSRQQRYAAEEV